MVASIAQMLGVIGADFSAPQTFAECLPWLAYVGIACGVLCMILNLIKYFTAMFAGRRGGLF